MNLYSTQEAAAYLGLSVATIKYHLYHTHALEPDARIGASLCFTQDTLDRFAESRRPPGRPPSDPRPASRNPSDSAALQTHARVAVSNYQSPTPTPTSGG